jgi:bile acid:Na+ symporter, BASS family
MLAVLWTTEKVIALSSIVLTLKLSIVLSVLALGLKATVAEATILARHPRALARALVAMYIVAPVVAIGLASAFPLPPAVKIAMVALSVGPVPPLFPMRAARVGGGHAYTIGLLVATAVLAIVLVPLTLTGLSTVFALSLRVSVVDIARLVLTTVLAPLAVGIGIRAVAPTFSEAVVRPLALVAGALLMLGTLLVLGFAGLGVPALIGNGTVAIMAVYTTVALAAGHVLGGPRMENRTVLAVATASRHPAIAIAIAHANFPEERLAPAAVLLFLLVNALVSRVYVTWIRHHGRADSAVAAAGAGGEHRAA